MVGMVGMTSRSGWNVTGAVRSYKTDGEHRYAYGLCIDYEWPSFVDLNGSSVVYALYFDVHLLLTTVWNMYH